MYVESLGFQFERVILGKGQVTRIRKIRSRQQVVGNQKYLSKRIRSVGKGAEKSGHGLRLTRRRQCILLSLTAST